MYKLKKEFKGQNVIVYTPSKKVIKLEGADQKELEEAFKIKGNEKFIEIDGRSKQAKEVKVEPKKVVKPIKK